MISYKVNVIELKKAMVEKELDKITDLAEASGISNVTLYKILNDELQPSTDVINKLISILEIPTETIGTIFFNSNLPNK